MTIFNSIAGYLVYIAGILVLVGFICLVALLVRISRLGINHTSDGDAPGAFNITVPAGHSEMQAQAVAGIVEQSFYGRNDPVSGTILIYSGDGYETKAYGKWLSENGHNNGNQVDVIYLPGIRPSDNEVRYATLQNRQR